MEEEEDSLVSSFREIVVGETEDTASRYLKLTNWDLNEALQLYYQAEAAQEIKAPLPIRRQTLYDNASNINMAYQQTPTTSVWKSDDDDKLANLYRPPLDILFNGSFEGAKIAGAAQDKWLLMNVQSETEFSSHMLNRDTWANEAVSEIIKSDFIFWQVNDNMSEGEKVRSYYKINSVPVILIIDPITGQKMKLWRGMTEADCLMEDLLSFTDQSPKDRLATLLKKPTTSNDGHTPASILYPPPPPPLSLPEEPKGDYDSNIVCRLGFRFPDGRRVQRRFLLTDPIQLMWTFCKSQLGESETRKFQLRKAMSGYESLDCMRKATFGELGLANLMIMVNWE